MPSHKFNIGDIVTLKPGRMYLVVCTSIKRLPGNGECEYRIKSGNEPHERVARESELTKA